MKVLVNVVLLVGVVMAPRVLAAEGAELAGDKYSTFDVGPLKRAQLKEMPPTAIATVGNTTIMKKYLDGKIAEVPEKERDVFERNQPFLLAQIVQREILLVEAKKRGLIKEEGEEYANEVIRKMVTERGGEVEASDEEVEQVYKEQKEHFGEADPKEVKTMLKAFLTQKKRHEAIARYLEESWKGTAVAVNKKWAAEQHKLMSNNPVDKARESGRVTVVDFGAEWCPPCKVLAPILEKLREELKDVNIVTIDVDKENVLAARYAIRNLPTLVFFDAKGKEVFRGEGLMSREEIIAGIDKARQGAKARD